MKKDQYNFDLIQSDERFQKNKSKVDYRFKIIYTIAMLSVIADHLRGRGSFELNIQGWFNYGSFHMQLFMFSAGYFFKSNNVSNTFDYIRKKFARLIIPIYQYNFFYGFYIQLLKKLGFKNNIRPFNFSILFIEPLGGCGFKHITPSWFSSSLFFVEVYNIIKRKIISLIKIELNESIYLIIDFFLSYYCVILSNRGYNKYNLYMHILRFIHLNVYYEFGIFFKKYLELVLIKVKTELYFITIFALKLSFHLYYSNAPVFYFGKSEYFQYSPYTVISISILGILFWFKIGEILEPILGTNFYINIIANNTFSIMINHSLAIDLIRTFFALISKNTKYCQNFDFNRYYSMDVSYIYIPNNVLQSGIIYFLNCLIFPIIISKINNKIKYLISNLYIFKYI